MMASTQPSLDRIPNPSIFCALVAQSVKDVRRDDQLMVELDSPGDAVMARTSTREIQDLALRNILVGGVMFVVGLGITWASYSASHAYYVIAIGPMLFGAFRFVRGLMAFGSGRSR